MSGYLIPLIIFFARICDVTLGTVRIIFVSRGMRHQAALLGFLEVLIWIVVIAQLIQHLDNWLNYIAYAGGFAVGTYLGIAIEDKLQVGTILMRIITRTDAGELIQRLRDAGFMITRVAARGGEGPVEIVFMVMRRKRWSKALEIIDACDADAFYSVEEVKYTSGEEAEGLPLPVSRSPFDRLLRVRKGI